MNERYLTAAVLIAIIAPCIYLGGIPLYILIAVLALIITWEINKLAAREWPPFLRLLMYPLMLVVLYASWRSIDYFVVAMIFSLIVLLAALVFEKKVAVEDVGLWFIMLNIVGFMIFGIALMYTVDRWMIFYMAVATALTDTAAYFVGRAYGKHKLNERISPNKTLEGSIGGYIAGCASSLLFAWFVLKPIWDMSPGFFISSSLIVPLTAQIGDLVFSAVKRRYQVKDFSNIFPGHGGALDRLDSISFSCMTIAILIIIFLT